MDSWFADSSYCTRVSGELSCRQVETTSAIVAAVLSTEAAYSFHAFRKLFSTRDSVDLSLLFIRCSQRLAG